MNGRGRNAANQRRTSRREPTNSSFRHACTLANAFCQSTWSHTIARRWCCRSVTVVSFERSGVQNREIARGGAHARRASCFSASSHGHDHVADSWIRLIRKAKAIDQLSAVVGGAWKSMLDILCFLVLRIAADQSKIRRIATSTTSSRAPFSPGLNRDLHLHPSAYFSLLPLSLSLSLCLWIMPPPLGFSQSLATTHFSWLGKITFSSFILCIGGFIYFQQYSG